MNSVIILRGCSGTGKSTWIKNEGQSYGNIQVFSADHYFLDSNNNYNFDASQLQNAHNQCLKNYLCYLCNAYNERTLVIDNTNTTYKEVARYAEPAIAFKKEVRIITLLCDPEVAYIRNVHGVPLDTVKKQHERLVKSVGQFPRQWNELVVE